MSDRILCAISSNPQSIHKLAGQSICGFKTRARRNAMKSLTLLHDAIDGLAKTSESARSRIISSMGQSVREKPLEGVEAVESLLASYNHAKETCTLDKEMITVLKKDPFIQKCEENIRYWCTMVFGHSNVLDEAIVDLRQNPDAVLDFLYQLKHTPGIYHSLAGFSICGFKNRERREAEANMEELMDCIQFYCGVVHSAKKFLQIEHCKRQKRAHMLQNQTSEAVARNVQHTRAEHHPTPQQEQPRRVESRRTALAM
ncbi:BID domain-containing T4SS effector [Bartonella taylorii]|uniref:BID domain-containing T4SS effector n=1 Tax=Bartonella taylorii TaxID=33046 RepID=UPI001FEF0165|nr:BID domain-containing T4SS effector [Bartonella taylorii]